MSYFKDSNSYTPMSSGGPEINRSSSSPTSDDNQIPVFVRKPQKKSNFIFGRNYRDESDQSSESADFGAAIVEEKSDELSSNLQDNVQRVGSVVNLAASKSIMENSRFSHQQRPNRHTQAYNPELMKDMSPSPV